MLTLRSGPAAGLSAQVALLAALGWTAGLGGFAWAVGLACGVVVNAAVALGLARGGSDALGPADMVTLARATCACGVAALVADAFVRTPAVPTLVALTVAALVLDAVDGWVARRTRTASVFGGWFDGEVDAFLILVLSVYAARSFGGWVLAIGAMRYVFAVAGWVLPWLRRRLPPRYWRKVVAATQGIVLTVAVAGVAPRSWTYVALAVALALLGESFGRDVWWLWSRRDPRPAGRDRHPDGGRRRRAVGAATLNALAVLVVWCALVAPNQAYRLAPGAFLGIPLEGLVLAALALVLPPRARRALAVVAGVLLGLLTLVKILDMAFFATLDRPFNPVTDPGYLRPAVGLVTDTVGRAGATGAFLAVAALVVAVLVLMPLSVGRLTGLVARHRGWSARAVTGLALVWVVGAASGLQVGRGEPVASTNASRLAAGHVGAIAAGVHDEERFAAAAAADRFRHAAGGDLLAGLRGKDVLVAFVESYGRTAIAGAPSSPQVRAVLEAGTRRLRAAGYSSRSAFLTSPTFGGLSWLAHATLQSGLWVDNQQRYDRLLSGHRMNLSRAFGRAGWRTVAVVPQNDAPWPEGRSFYGFDRIYDRDDIDYDGPAFGWAAVPDQYTLSAFRRLALAREDRAPVMAQVELVSSHAPWAPIPRMVGWDRVGDPTVYDRIHRRSDSREQLWRHPENVEAAYVDSVAYSLRAVMSFVQRYGDDDLVLVLLGDHQPATVVSGHRASHDVPVTVVAHDRTVLDRISAWGWQHGMRPGPKAPVWPMDAFRDRFLDAYSPPSPPAPARRQAAARP